MDVLLLQSKSTKCKTRERCRNLLKISFQSTEKSTLRNYGCKCSSPRWEAKALLCAVLAHRRRVRQDLPAQSGKNKKRMKLKKKDKRVAMINKAKYQISSFTMKSFMTVLRVCRQQKLFLVNSLSGKSLSSLCVPLKISSPSSCGNMIRSNFTITGSSKRKFFFL